MNIKQNLNQPVDKKIAWAVILILSIAAIVWIVSCNNKNNPKKDALVEETSSVVDTANEKPAVANPVSPAPVASKLSYSKALAKYGTNRIQFGDMCQATPANVTYKNGTAVMLDNRSSTARSINISGTVYRIAAYDYVVANMYSSSFPKTVLVDCGTQQNVATILIQK